MHTALLLMYNLFKIKLKKNHENAVQSWVIAESFSIEALPEYNKLVFANI